MFTINKTIKAIVLLFTLALCVGKIWDISSESRAEGRIKQDLQRYVQTEPRRAVGDAVDAAQGGVSDGAEGAAGHHNKPIFEGAPDLGEIPEETATDTGLTEAVSALAVNQFILDLQRDVNSDIVGWLRLDGTEVDYPVLAAGDNEEYLAVDVYGNEARSGCLFVDYRCAPDFSFNCIIYGHNMKNGSMFGSLRGYADPDFFSVSRYGTLWTAANTYSLEVFAYMLISSDDAEIYANPPSEVAFFDYIRENARVYREPSSVDKVFTLSTCAYDFEGARIVVIAAATGLIP